MEKQISVSHLVLKSIQELNRTREKIGRTTPNEMEQISKMFTPSKNSSFLFQNTNTNKNTHVKTEESSDQPSIKNAFFRRYAEITLGKDRVVEDNGFDLFMLGNKAKSLNVKKCANGDQSVPNIDNIIPRNRFLALNKILKLKSPKKLQPLQTLHNLKVSNPLHSKLNNSMTSKKTIKTQEDESEISKSIRKNRLLPVFSEQYRNIVQFRNESANMSPPLSSIPSITQSPNPKATPSSPPACPSPSSTLQPKSSIQSKLIAVKPLKKCPVNKIKQAIQNKEQKNKSESMELKLREVSSTKQIKGKLENEQKEWNQCQQCGAVDRYSAKVRRWGQAKKRYNFDQSVEIGGSIQKSRQFGHRYSHKNQDQVKEDLDKSISKSISKNYDQNDLNISFSQKMVKNQNRHKKMYTPLEPWQIQVQLQNPGDFVFGSI